MISKALRGGRLGGLVRYLFGPGRHEEHVHQRIVAGSDPTWVGTAAPDAETLRQLIAELDEPMVRFGDRTKDGYVYHVVVSVPKVDGLLSDEQWAASAELFAQKLGMDESVSWVAINHGPSANGNDHIHLVANLVRDDGRVLPLPFDRTRRRETCLELESRYGLTGTSPAGLGAGGLSRQEIEAVRGGRVAAYADLSRHRVSTTVRAVAVASRSEVEFVERLRAAGLLVRPRLAKDRPGQVAGYSVAARREVGQRGLVWYGGGTLGKDLRLPALRLRWAFSPAQLAAAAPAWESTAVRRRPAPERLAEASLALGKAAQLLEQIPRGDAAGWARVAADSAGVLAAAAAVMTDDVARRELIKAWKAVHRALPVATTAGVTTAPGDAAAHQLGVGADPAVTAWPVRDLREMSAQSQEVATQLSGVARVVMAGRLTEAPPAARVQALLVQAVQLVAQIARTLAAQRDASDAQRRAQAAVERAAVAAAAAPVVARRPAGWDFDRTGAQVLAEAAQGQVPPVGADVEATVSVPVLGAPQRGVERGEG